MEEKKKNFADTELENEMGYFKEPTLRLKNAEMEVAKYKEEGDLEKALHVAMQASIVLSIPFNLKTLYDINSQQPLQ